MTLAATGELAYNGVEFSGLFRSRVRGRRIPDRANRTTKWVEYTIEARGYVTASPGYGGAANATTDQEMETKRQALMATGGELQYEDKGFGTSFHVNGSGTMKDANWGPKPLLISFDPVGNDQAALVEWQCVTCVPECSGANYEGIADYSYETSYSIDQDAYTTRMISGML